MRDVNLNIRKAYYDILNGNVAINGQAVPIYNLFVPKGYPDYYILVQNMTSIGRESKSDQDREISIQFAICTRLTLNDGLACDKIADTIYQLCYPNRESVIPGCASMELVSDNTVGDFDDQGKKQIVERFIIFKHIITN